MSGGLLVKDDQDVSQRRSAVKRTALLLGLLAVAFYVAIFVLMASE